MDDAYWGEFEPSEMETAIRKYMGYARAGELRTAVSRNRERLCEKPRQNDGAETSWSNAVIG